MCICIYSLGMPPFRPSNNHHRDHFNLAGDPNLNLYLPRLHPGERGAASQYIRPQKLKTGVSSTPKPSISASHFCWSGTLAFGVSLGGREAGESIPFLSSLPWGWTRDFDFSCVKRLSITESQSGHYETMKHLDLLEPSST